MFWGYWQKIVGETFNLFIFINGGPKIKLSIMMLSRKKMNKAALFECEIEHQSFNLQLILISIEQNKQKCFMSAMFIPF